MLFLQALKSSIVGMCLCKTKEIKTLFFDNQNGFSVKKTIFAD